MSRYLASLLILLLGIWFLEALLLYDTIAFFEVYFEEGYGVEASWFGHQFHFLLETVLPTLFLPSVALIALTGVLAALLYLVARRFPQPASQVTVLLCSVAFVAALMGQAALLLLTETWRRDRIDLALEPHLMWLYWDPLWPKLLHHPLGLQLLLIPVLISICIIVGQVSRQRTESAEDRNGD